jgi:hypothetical protein
MTPLISLRQKLISYKYSIVDLSTTKNHQGEATMRQFTIAAATVAIAALISAAPASAERLQGGPMQQNGQCFKHTSGGIAESTWGYWTACPKPANAPAVQRPSRRRT